MKDSDSCWPLDVGVSEELVEEAAEEGGGGGRRLCDLCRRPSRVCWCPFVPRPPIQIASRIVVLQHPNEDKRGIRVEVQ